MSYIPHTQQDIEKMLQDIGLSSIDELFLQIPSSLKIKDLNIPSALPEKNLKEKIKKLAKKNNPLYNFNSFLGAGIYSHYIPSALKYLSNQPQFLTAYTPYQAEISQGILQALYEYQSYICILTGLEVSNASLYDGASALAEAVLMSLRINKKNKVLLSRSIHPQYREVVKTYLAPHDFIIKEIPFTEKGFLDLKILEEELEDASCFALQSPNFFGLVEDLGKIRRIVKEREVILILVTNLLSLAILKEPSQEGVDIVCGDTQVLGGFPSWGGSTCGFLAAKKEFLRQIPGRLVGETCDKEGKRAFCLTLQTREQHIRREKATSNICTNHSLEAIRTAIYLALLGREGFEKVALYSLNLAHYLYECLGKIKKVDFPFSSRFFNEFVWKADNAKRVLEKLYEKKIIGGLLLEKYYPELKDCVLSFTPETKTKEEIDEFINILSSIV